MYTVHYTVCIVYRTPHIPYLLYSLAELGVILISEVSSVAKLHRLQVSSPCDVMQYCMIISQ